MAFKLKCGLTFICILFGILDFQLFSASTMPDKSWFTVQLYEDISGTMSYFQVLEEYELVKFKPGKKESFGFTDSTLWLRYSQVKDIERLPDLFEFVYPQLDEVTIFYRLKDGTLFEKTLGDSISFYEREIKNNNIVFPIDFKNMQEPILYFRIRSSGPVIHEFNLWDQIKFYEYIGNQLGAHGIYYGAVLIMVLFNFILYIFIREISYFYYVLYHISYAFLQLNLSGFTFHYLWPSIPTLNNFIIPVSINVCTMLGIIFTISLLRVKSFAPLGYTIFRLFLLAGILGILISFIVPYRLSIIYAIGLNASTIIYGILLSIYLIIYKNSRESIFYLTAWGFLLSGALILHMRNSGILPVNLFTTYSIQIGAFLELGLLSIGLADRYNTLQRNLTIEKERTIQIQRDNNIILERVNLSLEKEVDKRTYQLQEELDEKKILEKELTKLATIDSLTQILNRRAFIEQSEKELSRSMRYNNNFIFLMIDIDKFKKINDTYGHDAGDAVLKNMAKELKQSLRKTDILGRIGGEEFAVILHQTNLDNANLVADKIRLHLSTVKTRINKHVIMFTVSIGISEYYHGESSIDSIKTRADEALYQAKKAGRNKVIVWDVDSKWVFLTNATKR